MEIYLKSKESKSLFPYYTMIVKTGNTCETLQVINDNFENSVQHFKWSDSIDCRHAKMVSRDFWDKSTKAEFTEAYKQAMNTLHTFQLNINKK